MPWKIWTYDIAREQAPSLEQLDETVRWTQESGYDAIGLYLEHRFAYPSTPWAHGKGCVTPEMVATLQQCHSTFSIVPFINLLGHMEGFIYTQFGERFAEEPYKGLQASQDEPGFAELTDGLIDDTIASFKSDLIHIGGDETFQLGARRAKQGEEPDKARIYGEHFGRCARRVLAAGRRPAIWGDMLLTHPEAAEFIPRETLVFDWQYFNGLSDSAPKLTELGFEVVGCPALHTYNAPWLHVPESEANLREVSRDVQEMGLYGVCLTTWECGLFGDYETLVPALKVAPQLIEDPTACSSFLEAYGESAEWARLMGEVLPQRGPLFQYSKIRSSLKARLLMAGNPMMLWRAYRDQWTEDNFKNHMRLLDEALAAALTPSEKGVTLFVRGAIEFGHLVQRAHDSYSQRDPESAISALGATRMIFNQLMQIASNKMHRGGSIADQYRCQAALEHVEKVIRRLRDFGHGELGYLPSFEVLCQPQFTPHDQGCWWRINRWTND